MNTNKAIQDVLATGKLGLPPCVSIIELEDEVLLSCRAVVVDNTEPWRLQEALDKIAMHWAREMPHDLLTGAADKEFDRLMGGGLSEAAIAAIYEALCGGKE